MNGREMKKNYVMAEYELDELQENRGSAKTKQERMKWQHLIDEWFSSNETLVGREGKDGKTDRADRKKV